MRLPGTARLPYSAILGWASHPNDSKRVVDSYLSCYPCYTLFILLYTVCKGDLGLGSRNRTYAPASQTQSDTISPYRELIFLLSQFHSNKRAAKCTKASWNKQHMISSVIYYCNTCNEKNHHRPYA